MKVSKKVFDSAMTVVGFSEKYLIGAGLSALVIKMCDKEVFDRIGQDWSSKTKKKYVIIMAVATTVAIFVDAIREMILNSAYDAVFSGEDEIKIDL